MIGKSKTVVHQNPYNGTWDVGWQSNDGEFRPGLCGYATREEAEAKIPGFNEAIEEVRKEREAEERWNTILLKPVGEPFVAALDEILGFIDLIEEQSGDREMRRQMVEDGLEPPPIAFHEVFTVIRNALHRLGYRIPRSF